MKTDSQQQSLLLIEKEQNPQHQLSQYASLELSLHSGTSKEECLFLFEAITRIMIRMMTATTPTQMSTMVLVDRAFTTNDTLVSIDPTLLLA